MKCWKTGEDVEVHKRCSTDLYCRELSASDAGEPVHMREGRKGCEREQIGNARSKGDGCMRRSRENLLTTRKIVHPGK